MMITLHVTPRQFPNSVYKQELVGPSRPWRYQQGSVSLYFTDQDAPAQGINVSLSFTIVTCRAGVGQHITRLNGAFSI